MDIKSISSVFSPIHGLIKEIWNFKLEKALSDRVVALNELIFSAQSNMLTQQETITMLRAKNDELEKEICRLTEWEEEKKHYYMHEPIPGSFVWRYRPDDGANQTTAQRPKPSHDLCPRCFDKNERSVLQGSEYQGHRLLSKKCFSCGLVAYVDKPPKSTIEFF